MPAQNQQPDILMIVLDTQRVDRLSCYGYEHETSPYLDAFAEDATLFQRAIAPAQWTVPSHASMFTGVYPSVHGTQHAHTILPNELPTLAQRLTDHGYYTAAFCNNPLVGVVNNGLRRGFFSFLNYSGILTSRPNQAGVPLTVFGRYRQVFKRVLGGFVHKVQDAFARSDALLNFAFTPIMLPLWQSALSFKGNTAKSLNDAAQLHISRKETLPNQPIFSFVNLMGTHMPFHPMHEHVERYAPGVLQDREAQKYLRKFNSDVFGWLAPLGSDMAAEHSAIINGMYDAEVASQDQHLGQFFEKLRSSGKLDNTMVIICADHGEHLGEKHLIGHSISAYNLLTHVPLIIRDPAGNLTRGDVRDNLVSTRRLYHTILTAAGAATPQEMAYNVAQSAASDPDDGTVFAEAVTSQNVLNIIQKHKPELVARHRCDQPRRAVWNGQHKLILTGPEHRELFNLASDPTEDTNLYTQLPDTAATLHEHIRAFELHNATVAKGAGRITEQIDSQLQRHLRALGYLD